MASLCTGSKPGVLAGQRLTGGGGGKRARSPAAQCSHRAPRSRPPGPDAREAPAWCWATTKPAGPSASRRLTSQDGLFGSQTQLCVSCWGCGLLGRRGARGGSLWSRRWGPGPATSEPRSPAADGPGGSWAGPTHRCTPRLQLWRGGQAGGRRAGRRGLAEGSTEESGLGGDQRGVRASLQAPRTGLGGRSPCCVPHTLFTSLVSSRLLHLLLSALGDVGCSLWPRGTH